MDYDFEVRMIAMRKLQFPAGARDQCAGGERHRHHPLGGHRPE